MIDRFETNKLYRYVGHHNHRRPGYFNDEGKMDFIINSICRCIRILHNNDSISSRVILIPIKRNHAHKYFINAQNVFNSNFSESHWNVRHEDMEEVEQ